jgi:hypothetical protein
LAQKPRILSLCLAIQDISSSFLTFHYFSAILCVYPDILLSCPGIQDISPLRARYLGYFTTPAKKARSGILTHSSGHQNISTLLPKYQEYFPTSAQIFRIFPVVLSTKLSPILLSNSGYFTNFDPDIQNFNTSCRTEVNVVITVKLCSTKNPTILRLVTSLLIPFKK